MYPAVALLAACLGPLAQGGGSTERPEEDAPMLQDRFLRENRLNLWLMAQTAPVVVARTESAGAAPSGWSDHFLASQRLELTVLRRVCGEGVATGPLARDVPVVKGARTSGSTPGLAPWITEPGSVTVQFVGSATDEDLALLPHSDDLERWLQAACGGEVPPAGVAGVLHLLAAAPADALAGVPTSVLDIETPEGAVRVTVHQGKLRVFSGVRYARVAQSRGADGVISVDAGHIVGALTGAGGWTVKQPGAEALLEALTAVARGVPTAQLEAAAG